MFFHTTPSAPRPAADRSGSTDRPGLIRSGRVPVSSPRLSLVSRADGTAGDPWGRRVIFLHPGKGAWWRLLHGVPPGQEWMTVPSPGNAPLHPLLVERGGRKPVLVAGVLTAAAALGAALDHPDAVGGVMIVDDVGADSALRRRLGAVASLFGLPVDGTGLGALETELPAVRVPVTLMQGSAPATLMGTLESGLTGCRTLTVLAVPDAGAVRPRTHAAELRTALAALIAAVERTKM
ncbi:alpha/beta hydrolase [Azospirillum doebereinerae]|uniref:alpha/beta hydrolase n=1 Tax=Azospirillum doebereinerae TaxID=92933 RepID=UPI00163BE473|nr:alpha/beta hydrolase [Azospirillum doebereinerae]MCG5241786.1 alpha/beta hydrolase [Azospirillum doebereinerae]